MILFLDFDGVLHPVARTEKECFSQLPLLEDWLRKHSNVNVIISSSWRDVITQDELEQIFSADIHTRIIGRCPMETDFKTIYYRYEEIMAWIAFNEYKGDWIALDDTVQEFPPKFEKLVACDPKKGVTEVELEKLSQFFNK